MEYKSKACKGVYLSQEEFSYFRKKGLIFYGLIVLVSLRNSDIWSFRYTFTNKNLFSF